ncbi:MAG: hypothetical protein H0T76_28980 [Nannocystis sp.]|nr:hypothetical protein [Nannocystis sp.]MBA3550529.1 hypothetical protein [Nannocystis sp.]
MVDWARGAWLCACLGLVTCDTRPAQRAEPSCPPCDCECKGAPPQQSVATPVQPVATPVQQIRPEDRVAAPLAGESAEIGELVASATRKTNFNDGAGCLRDLDRVAQLDPKLDARLAVSRGQCEMLAGRCQEGKQRVARWYETETNMHPERAMVVAESLGSMRCRDGNSSERDQLLRAYFELSDGAYVNKKTPAECAAAIGVARKLIPRVKPQGPEDGQISGGAQALFHTAATCLGRAGDCKAAYATYSELYPAMPTVNDPAMREKIMRDSFASSIVHCKKSP